MVLTVSVLYQERALPICWIVYKGKKGHTTARRHIEALTKTLPLVPAESRVNLWGDAEYDTTEMLLWVKKQERRDFLADIAAKLCARRLTKPANERLSVGKRTSFPASPGWFYPGSSGVSEPGWLVEQSL